MNWKEFANVGVFFCVAFHTSVNGIICFMLNEHTHSNNKNTCFILCKRNEVRPTNDWLTCEHLILGWNEIFESKFWGYMLLLYKLNCSFKYHGSHPNRKAFFFQTAKNDQHLNSHKMCWFIFTMFGCCALN